LQSQRDRREEYRQQLIRLYGPIWILTRHTYQLQILLGGDHPGWRFLEHVEDIMSDRRSRQLAHELVDTNEKIVATMVENAGLSLDGTIHQSFLDFLVHASVVRTAVSTGVSPPETNRPHYPKELDDHVKKCVARLRRCLDISEPNAHPAPRPLMQPA
jgi:hypothetical protein